MAYPPNEFIMDPLTITQLLNSSQIPTHVYDPHLLARSSASVRTLSSVMHDPNLYLGLFPQADLSLPLNPTELKSISYTHLSNCTTPADVSSTLTG